MPIVLWSEVRHSVGIDEIDQQHRELFNLGNQIDLAFASGQTPAALESLITGLHQAARAHFTDEEDLLLYGPGELSADHHAEHAIILSWIEMLAAKVRTGELRTPTRLMDLLRTLIERHVIELDQEAFRPVSETVEPPALAVR